MILQRRCVGCGKSYLKNDLLHIVKSKDGIKLLTSNEYSDGRSAYLCRSMKCLDKARKCKGLEKSFKAFVDNNIYDAIEKELAIGKQ